MLANIIIAFTITTKTHLIEADVYEITYQTTGKHNLDISIPL